MNTLNVLRKLNICPFFIKDEKLLKVYNKVLDKSSNILQKEIESELVYNEKYLKSKNHLTMIK